MAIVMSADGNRLGWTCNEYCLDPTPPVWLDAATPNVVDVLDRMGLEHFAEAHTPADLKASVLAADTIPLELIRQAVYDVAVKATEREQRQAKIALGILSEETTP